jgi:hypothetical protein
MSLNNSTSSQLKII